MLRRTNDSCSLPRHTLSQRSHPERGTRRDVSSPSAPRVTPGVSLPRCFECAPLTVSTLFLLCRSLDSAVSGVVCVHLLCSHSSGMDAIVMTASVIKAMRENHSTPPPPADFQECTWDTETYAYAGLFWVKAQSRESLTVSDRYMLRTHNSLQPFDLSRIVSKLGTKVCLHREANKAGRAAQHYLQNLQPRTSKSLQKSCWSLLSVRRFCCHLCCLFVSTVTQKQLNGYISMELRGGWGQINGEETRHCSRS